MQNDLTRESSLLQDPNKFLPSCETTKTTRIVIVKYTLAVGYKSLNGRNALKIIFHIVVYFVIFDCRHKLLMANKKSYLMGMYLALAIKLAIYAAQACLRIAGVLGSLI